jgi:hypothetical protein
MEVRLRASYAADGTLVAPVVVLEPQNPEGASRGAQQVIARAKQAVERCAPVPVRYRTAPFTMDYTIISRPIEGVN